MCHQSKRIEAKMMLPLQILLQLGQKMLVIAILKTLQKNQDAIRFCISACLPNSQTNVS